MLPEELLMQHNMDTADRDFALNTDAGRSYSLRHGWGMNLLRPS